MSVLIDTSVWIDYFKGGKNSEKLDYLIDNNLILVNDLILTELIPLLKIKRQNHLIHLLENIKKLPLKLNWQELIEFQFKCLKKGVNGIGIPDLIIVQNALQNDCEIYTLDKHFRLIQKVLKIRLYT
ncbi:MAG: PIN domain-containing protein [Nitrospirae bacterium]|nr:PIN domain-containing protein [Nitrospirota bacterium]